VNQNGTTYPRELELILCCARTRISGEARTRIRELLNEQLDWRRFLEAAENHGVKALVSRQLLNEFAEAVPSSWREILRKDFEAHARRNLILTAELVRVVSLFESAGIPAIPYKGPALAEWAYGDVALRQFTDLDIAVRQRDIPRAAGLLEREGYRSEFGAIAATEGERPMMSEYGFRHAAWGLLVELQTETTLRYFPRRLDLDDLSTRRKRVGLAGGKVSTFSPEDTLLLLSVHGAKHFWERLMWVADIAELARTENGMDWERAFAAASRMGVRRIVRLALGAAGRLVDAPLPDAVKREVESDAAAGRLAEGICRRYSLSAQMNVPVFERFRFRVRLRENFWQGLRYGMRLATSPTNPDQDKVPLRPRLRRLHRVLRPFLLISRYGIRRAKPNE